MVCSERPSGMTKFIGCLGKTFRRMDWSSKPVSSLSQTFQVHFIPRGYIIEHFLKVMKTTRWGR